MKWVPLFVVVWIMSLATYDVYMKYNQEYEVIYEDSAGTGGGCSMPL